ncbi:MAG TPA: hypothetical protein VJ385_07825 [Fibrobacteria bacterium]|nr:hypothetical protein [Fibrobacteria bacterium]
MGIANPLALLAVTAALPFGSRADDPKVEYHGAGWLQMGRVEKSFTTEKHEINNYTHTWMRNAGAVFEANVSIDEHWDGRLGLGAVNVHLSRGKTTNANIWYPFWVPFVPEAQITHTNTFSENSKLSFTFGSFGVDYNPDAKNLGLYLMRGYVYPGSLVSGFTGPLGVLAATTGAMGSYRFGKFQYDQILVSETEDKPLYDFSLAEILTVRPAPGLEFGFGANHYRFIAQDKRLTSPGKDCRADMEMGENGIGCFEVVNTLDADGNILSSDTITGSLAGTKLMARFHVDPKAMFGLGESLGGGELVLYGEAAVLGVKNVGNYYKDIMRRIPVMMGFNFPTWRILDNLSLEVEYYASRNSSDNLGAQFGSWIPNVDPDVNNARDDWKWSLNIDKIVAGHVKFSAQVANDHLRVGGYHNYATGVETTTTPEDWYWTTKAVYFF